MKPAKFVFSLILIILISCQNIFAQKVNIYFKPVLGISFPESKTLKTYYNQNRLYTFGGSLTLITSFYELGVYLGFNKYSINIKDNNQPNLEESGSLYKTGLIKRFSTNIFSFDTKAGLIIIKDKLAGPFNSDSRIGFEAGASFDKKIYGRLYSFLEVNYAYDKVKIPEYSTYTYSRHQKYLSGKNIKNSGYLIQTGISILLF